MVSEVRAFVDLDLAKAVPYIRTCINCMYPSIRSIGLCKTTSWDVVLHTSQKDYKLPYRCMKIF